MENLELLELEMNNFEITLSLSDYAEKLYAHYISDCYDTDKDNFYQQVISNIENGYIIIDGVKLYGDFDPYTSMNDSEAKEYFLQIIKENLLSNNIDNQQFILLVETIDNCIR